MARSRTPARTNRTRTSTRTPRALVASTAALVALATILDPAAAHHSRFERLSAGAANGNGAFDATFRGASSGGSRVFFETGERLSGADTDTSWDVYERSGGTTRRVSAGDINGNGPEHAFYEGASGDGTRVFFSSREPLVATDTDEATDIYQRFHGVTTLVSAGSVNGNGLYDVVFAGASSDGTRVFFETDEPLVAGDTDVNQDVYRRSGGKTVRVSTNAANGNGAFDSRFLEASTTGARVLFWTDEPLVADDADTSWDVYERSGGVTTRISAGAINGNGAFDANFAGASDDGTRVFFATPEPLVAADTDTSHDVYQRFGGTTRRVSAGAINGNGPFAATLAGTSADGTRAFFVTSEPLVAADTDTVHDIYERAGGVTARISIGSTNGNGTFPASFEGASDDGTWAFFSTRESLRVDDTDTAVDIYQRGNNGLALVSIGAVNGNGNLPSFFAGASADGSKVFFVTAESLVASDTDGAGDIYERSDLTATNVVSPGNGTSPALFQRASGDGSVVIYATTERVIVDDTDSTLDLYGAYRVQ